MGTNIIEWVEQQRLTIKEHLKDRPEITLAYAQSIDGSFTRRKGSTSTISNPDSTVLTHQLRAIHSAIMVGIGTLLADNPQLTVRFAGGNNPIPVLVDTDLKIPLDARILQNASNFMVFCSKHADKQKFDHLVSLGIQVIGLEIDEFGLLPLNQVLKILGKAGIDSLMVEGGPKVIHSLLSNQLWDLAVITVAPFWMGGYGLEEFEFKENVLLRNMHTDRVGDDLILMGERV